MGGHSQIQIRTEGPELGQYRFAHEDQNALCLPRRYRTFGRSGHIKSHRSCRLSASRLGAFDAKHVELILDVAKDEIGPPRHDGDITIPWATGVPIRRR
jgi:hypothetical protein